MSFKQTEIVAFLSVILNNLLELASPDPCYVVLHISCNMKSWISHSIHTYFYVTLFDVRNCVFYCFCHLQALHDDRQASSREGANCDLLAGSQSLSSIDYSHLKKLVSQLVCFGYSIIVVLLECLELGNQFRNLANQFVVLGVVFAVLDVVPTKYSNFTNPGILFPFQKVNFF